MFSRMSGNKTKTFADIYNLSTAEYEGAQISSFPFSVRTSKRFSERGIATVADLLKTSPETLMNIRGFGRTSLEEVERFFTEQPFSRETGNRGLVRSSISLNAFRETARSHMEQIVFGDFSFTDQLELNSDEGVGLQQYKDAFFTLGDELAFDCVSSPERVEPIIEMLQNYLCEEKTYHDVKQLLDLIPATRKVNSVVGYINAFTIKDYERLQLLSFFASETSTIISIITCKSFEDDEALTLLKKFLRWCTFNLKEEIESLLEKVYFNERARTVISLRARKHTLQF